MRGRFLYPSRLTVIEESAILGRTMADSTPDNAASERLSESLDRELDRILGSVETSHQLWESLQRLGPAAPDDSPLKQALRTSLRAELRRREQVDEERIREFVEEALVTGDLRPYWAACDLYANTSPDLTVRLFPHEPETEEADFPRDATFSWEAYEAARAIIRERLAAIEEATPTGSSIEAFAVLEDAILREEPAAREPLRFALELERKKQSRTQRNLLRTRLALSLTAGRSYEHFVSNRIAYADLSPDERATFFATD